MTVLSVDPGDRTGWAVWGEDGFLIRHGIDTAQDFLVRLARQEFGDVRIAAYEQFRLQRHRARQQSGSSMLASQVIGALRLYAIQHTVRLVAQEVDAKTIAAMHSGIKVPADHKKSHDIEAILHGWYLFECLGIEPCAPGVPVAH